MWCFFGIFILNMFKQKLPQGVKNRWGGEGVKALFGKCPEGSSFFRRGASLSQPFNSPKNILNTSMSVVLCAIAFGTDILNIIYFIQA